MHDEPREPARPRHSFWRRYFDDARQAIHNLVMLAPIVLVVEVVGRLAQPPGMPFRSQVGRELIEAALSVLGVAGSWLPPAALLATLIWLTARTGRWRIRPLVPCLMLVEALVTAIPLLVLARVLGPLIAGDGLPVSRLCDGIGAGLYEELVFRFLLISLLLLVARMWLPKSSAVGCRVAAVLLAGVAFAWAHFHPLGGEAIDWVSLLSRSIAGWYLGYLFIQRGLGIAAGAHAAYNALMILSAG